MTGVKKMEEFIREHRLKWVGHMKKKWMIKELQQKAKIFLVNGSMKGRSKKRCKEVVEKDMLVTGLRRTDSQNRLLWRIGCENRLILFAEKTSRVPRG